MITLTRILFIIAGLMFALAGMTGANGFGIWGLMFVNMPFVIVIGYWRWTPCFSICYKVTK